MRQAILFAAISHFVLATFAQTPVPDPSTVGHTKGPFHKCPPIGDARLDGGPGDPYLNALKNRDEPPTDGTYVKITVTELIADKPPGAIAAGKKRRDQWTLAQRASVDAQEKQAIEVVGFLALPPKKEGKDSCNCHSTQVDYLMWLVENYGDPPAKAMVVEISPRMLEKHPNWPKIMAEVAEVGYVVLRVRGWRTWDQEHPEQLGQTRGTLWEIHPIHEIDTTEENDYWIPIDKSDNDQGTSGTTSPSPRPRLNVPPVKR